MASGSGPHVVALVNSGELYSWGHNGYGQLGLGMVGNQLSRPQIIKDTLESCKVTHVACGGHHTLVLTSEGKVRDDMVYK